MSRIDDVNFVILNTYYSNCVHFQKLVQAKKLISIKKKLQKNADVSSHVTLETCLTRKILSVVYTDHVCKVSYLGHDLHNAMPNSPHYYNFIKKHLDVELLFTDKDSLTYEIKSEDVYEEFFKHKHLFDCSNYPKDS